MTNPNRMTTEQAAEYLRLTVGTLGNMRSNGNGPDFYKMGGVFYKQSDLDAFIESKRVSGSTKREA